MTGTHKWAEIFTGWCGLRAFHGSRERDKWVAEDPQNRRAVTRAEADELYGQREVNKRCHEYRHDVPHDGYGTKRPEFEHPPAGFTYNILV